MSMETSDKRKGLKVVLIASAVAAILSVLVAAQLSTVARHIALAGVTLGLAFVIAGLRSRSQAMVFRSGLVAAAVMLVPIATATPAATTEIVALALGAALLAFLRLSVATTAGSTLVLAGVAIAYPGLSTILLPYILFFALGAAAVILRSRGEKEALLRAGQALGLAFVVLAVTLKEMALRVELPGTQLPVAQWALLAAVAATALVLATSNEAWRAAGKLALPAMLCVTLLGLTATPAQSAASMIKSDNQGASLLAQIAGSAGSTKMIGEEGAGPRAQFVGIDFEACDYFSIRDCLITYFDTIASQKGIQASLDAVVEKVKNNQGVTFPTHCHQSIHNLGQLAYELTDGDFELVSSYDPQVCGTGFIHGLYEKYFDRYGDYIFTDTENICSKMGLTSAWYSWTCSHILGHTMMTKSMQNPVAGGEYCLPMLESLRFADCAAGAWMNFWADDKVTEWFGKNSVNQPEEAFAVCYSAVRYSKFFCYEEIFPVLTKLSDNNLPQMAIWCETLSEPARADGPTYLEQTQNYADRCMQGVARAVAVTTSYDYRVGIVRCDTIESDAMRDTCLAGLGASISMNTGSLTAGNEACERIRNKGYRDYCFVWVKQSYTTLTEGPNASNLPKFGEVRIPERLFTGTLPPKTTSDTAS